MAEPVSGLGDFLKVGFDYKKMISAPDFRFGIEKIANAVKDATTSPLNLDDKVIDGMVLSIEAWLDSLKAQSGGGGLVVGAMAPTPVESANAVTALAKLGTFDAAVVSKVKAHPKVLEVIDHRSKEQQVKILNSEWLDKIIGWITTYGPMIAKLLMFLIPLL